MKSIDMYHLGQFLEPELQQLERDLRSMGLFALLSFRKPWNNEVICQFYASYYLDNANNTIHWTTEGVHYKVDALTFFHLLGLGCKDRQDPRISDMQPLAASEYQYMYQEGHVADGQTVWLKPYFYVLNNILRQTLYPKIVDSTFLQDDYPVVLDCFGDEFTRFSIGHYIWDKIF